MFVEGNFIDVVKGEIYPAKITFSKTISKIEPNNKKYETYIAPGFIESHLEVEQSLLSPAQYVRYALLSGVTAVVEDFSGFLRAFGNKGVKYAISEFKKTPLEFFYLYPVNVETSKLESGPEDVKHEDFVSFLKNKHCLGLTQVDTVKHIREQDPKFLKKINAAKTVEKPIISNIPKVHFTDLSSFAHLGIRADFGSNIYQEAFEKACFGIKIKIVEGTKRKTLGNLIRLAKQFDTSIVSDEKSSYELNKGYMRLTLKKAVSLGLDPLTAVKNVTINPAKLLGIDLGTIEVGKPANIVELESIKDFKVRRVFMKGEKIVNGGKLVKYKNEISKEPKNYYNLIDIDSADLAITSDKKFEKVKVISLEDNTLVEEKLPVKEGVIVAEKDVYKVVVAGTYGSNQISIAYVKGFKIDKGALATSLYGSSGNIIAIGQDDEEIATAINKTKNIGGGKVGIDKKRESIFKLPIYGLVTNADAVEIHENNKKLNFFLRRLGCGSDDPFTLIGELMNLNLPGYRISNHGVVNTEKGEIVSIFE